MVRSTEVNHTACLSLKSPKLSLPDLPCKVRDKRVQLFKNRFEILNLKSTLLRRGVNLVSHILN